jgi:hypothetical protein
MSVVSSFPLPALVYKTRAIISAGRVDADIRYFRHPFTQINENLDLVKYDNKPPDFIMVGNILTR